MSVVLVLMGLLMLVALQSQGVINQYRQSQFTNQVRALQSGLLAYRQQHGRWPGDCNQDGLIDYGLLGTEVAVDLDYAAPTGFEPAADVDTAYTLGTVCPERTLAPYEKLNVAYNELKRSGQSPVAQPNRLVAVHRFGGVALLGSFDTELTDPDPPEHFNALLLTSVPIAAARKLAVAIDGFDGSAANLGRVRRIDIEAGKEFAALWTAAGETEDKRITVAVFFDRIPPTTLAE